MWKKALTTKMAVIDPLPKHPHQAFAEGKGRCIDQMLAPATPQDHEQAWMCVIFFDKLVVHTRTDNNMTLNQSMRNRLRMAAEGEWHTLVTEALEAWGVKEAGSLGQGRKDPDKAVALRVATLAKR